MSGSLALRLEPLRPLRHSLDSGIHLGGDGLLPFQKQHSQNDGNYHYGTHSHRYYWETSRNVRTIFRGPVRIFKDTVASALSNVADRAPLEGIIHSIAACDKPHFIILERHHGLSILVDEAVLIVSILVTLCYGSKAVREVRCIIIFK